MSIKQFHFSLPDITCINCIKPIEKNLLTSKLLKVLRVNPDVDKKTITIDVNDEQRLTAKEIKRQLIKIIHNTGNDCEDITVKKEKIPSFWTSHLFLGSIGTIAGIALILLSIFLPVIPLAASIAIGVASTLLTLALGAPSYYSAFKKFFKSGTLTMDTLFTISTLTVLVVSIAAFFVPGLSMMFEAGLLIFGFRHIGQAIEDKIKSKINDELEFQDQLPLEVRMNEADGPLKKISELTVDDVVYLAIDANKPSAKVIIPADGIALTKAVVYETILKGSVLPRTIEAGEVLVAGMYLAEDSPPLKIKLTPISLAIASGERIPINSLCLQGEGLIEAGIERKAIKEGDVLNEGDILWEQSSPIKIELKDSKQSVLIKPAEKIPAESICLEGSAYIEKRIARKSVKQGDVLNEGDLLSDESLPIEIQIKEDLASFSYLARMDRRIKEARNQKAPIEETTTKILKYFIPTVIAVTIIVGFAVSFFFPPFLAIKCAIAILVSACPCILGLINSLAINVGFKKTASNGVHFKSNEGIEAAAKTTDVLLDLNGTLTLGEPEVSEIQSLCQEISREVLLDSLKLLEEKSKHPHAIAIKEYIKQQGLVAGGMRVFIPDVDQHHSGMRGKIGGVDYILGNQTLMKDHEVDLTTVHLIKLEEDESVVYLARKNPDTDKHELIGYVVLRDRLRDGAVETVQALINLGMTVHICTGADEETAKRYAKKLGVLEKNVHAGCVSFSEKKADKGKTTYIQTLQKQGKIVSFIGDGDNDTPALKLANCGIAMESNFSTEMPKAMANAFVNKEQLKRAGLRPIANAFKIANQTISNIKQNLGFTLSYNFLAMLLSGGLLILLGLVMNPAIGVALMVAQACLVLLNIYRLKHQSVDFNLQAIESNLELGKQPEEESCTKIQRSLGKTRQLEPDEQEPACGQALWCGNSQSFSVEESQRQAALPYN